MKTAHRYVLEPYKGMNTRYHCPAPDCGKGKTFSLYIDTQTGEHLHPTVGRCNRESNCGYHYTPKQYFQDNNISFDTPLTKAYKPRPFTPQPKPVSFIPVEIFKASLKAHETNHFAQFLIKLFGVEVASQLVSRYFIATSKHWSGATVFWQIDTQGKVRTGKIMLYNPTTGKRVKEPFNHINWVHKALKQPEFELRQCLFGEHLLIEKTKPVGIVESEKTAIIASVWLPQFIWVAVGSITNLNAEKCSILKGRTVTLFPDLNGFEKWSNKAKELSHLANFQVSDLLERKATEAERRKGLDLADYLVRFDPLEFKSHGPVSPELSPIEQIKVDDSISKEVKPTSNVSCKYQTVNAEPNNWDDLISELEAFFDSLPDTIEPIRIKPYIHPMKDIKEFSREHLKRVKDNNGCKGYRPYLDTLIEVKDHVTGSKPRC